MGVSENLRLENAAVENLEWEMTSVTQWHLLISLGHPSPS
jgi:hypothetical protein